MPASTMLVTTSIGFALSVSMSSRFPAEGVYSQVFFRRCEGSQAIVSCRARTLHPQPAPITGGSSLLLRGSRRRCQCRHIESRPSFIVSQVPAAVTAMPTFIAVEGCA